jgi:Uma2 family endonuclease
MYQTDPPLTPKELLPTMYDLPSEEPGKPCLPDFLCELLCLTFRPPNYPLDQILVASNLNLYYDSHHPQWYKRLDWVAVLGVSSLDERWYLRFRYVVWHEKIAPFIVVKLLFPGIEADDLGRNVQEASQPPTKWEVYEQILGIPYYVVFDCYTDRLQVFGLKAGRYQELKLENQRLWLEEVQLGLGLWRGTYQGIERLWLRWYDGEGNWMLTSEEQERLQAEQVLLELEQERRQRQLLAAKLRELGINPDAEGTLENINDFDM